MNDSQKSKSEKLLYNSRIIDNYIKLINEQYSFIDVDELLNKAGMASYQVKDEGHWFTQTQINSFHKELQNWTGHENIAYEAGAFSASSNTLGTMRSYILSLLGPYRVYEMLGKLTKQFTRSSDYEVRKIDPYTLEVTVTPNQGVQEETFQCQNRLGYLEGLAKLFEGKAPQIIHNDCLFKEASYCRYIISLPTHSTALGQRIKNIIQILLVATFALSFTILPSEDVFFKVLPPLLIVFFGIGWFAESLRAKKFKKSIDTTRDSSNELVNQININYDNALLVNETARILGKNFDIEGILENVATLLEKRLDFSRGMILLANADNTKIVPSKGYGYTEDQLQMISEWPGFNLNSKESKGIFVQSFHNREPLLVDDFERYKGDHSKRSIKFAQSLGIKSFICCPIYFEEESLGILAVDGVASGRQLLQRDINLLMGIAQQIGVAIYHNRLDTQMRHSQKMQALGSLAGGISHDFNNMLSAIMGYTDMALLEAKEGSELQEYLNEVIVASVRARNLVKQILTFSCKIEQNKRPLALDKIVYEVTNLVQATLPKSVAIHHDICTDCSRIIADETQVHQVVLNICTNAFQAMEGSEGTLEIHLRDAIISNNDSSFHTDLRPGKYVKLTIRDNGRGMDSVTMERIFDPYFTTKKDAGSGIGLSVVHGIVKRHNGAILVDSRVGVGTEFQVFFPQGEMVEASGGVEDKDLPAGSERILVVDDEQSIARLMQKMLEGLGYIVTPHTDSIRALGEFKASPNSFDLVITDYNMPGMDGVKLSRKMLEIKKELPIILLSGIAEKISSENLEEIGIQKYLQKPIMIKELAQVLRQSLGP